MLKELKAEVEFYDQMGDLIAKFTYFEGAYSVKIEGFIEPDTLRGLADRLEELNREEAVMEESDEVM